MEDNRQPIGILFKDLNYYSIEELNKFIDNMNKEQALFVIIKAAQAGFLNNMFDLQECEVLSKAIRKMSDNSDVVDSQS